MMFTYSVWHVVRRLRATTNGHEYVDIGAAYLTNIELPKPDPQTALDVVLSAVDFRGHQSCNLTPDSIEVFMDGSMRIHVGSTMDIELRLVG